MKYEDLVNYKECIMVRNIDKDKYVPLILFVDTFKSIVSIDEISDKIFITCKGLKLLPLDPLERTLIAGVRTNLEVGKNYYIKPDKNSKFTYNFIDTDNYEYAVFYDPIIKTMLKFGEVDMRVSQSLKYKLLKIEPEKRELTVRLLRYCNN